MSSIEEVRALVDQGKIGEAVMQFRDWMLSEDRKVDGAYMIGELEMTYGNLGQGLIVTAQALNLAPDRKDIADAVAAGRVKIANRADEFAAAGDAAAAVALLRCRLAVTPNEASTLARLASLAEPLAAQAGRESERRNALLAVLCDVAALTGGDFAFAAARHGLGEAYEKECAARPSYAVGVTTFDKRFHTYFTPLLHQVRAFAPRADIVVCVNGNNQQKFDETYRREILQLLSGVPNAYPIIFPMFRGLSRMWNAIAINTSADYVLLLNDDVSIFEGSLFPSIESAIHRLKSSFKINRLWSHFVMSRRELDQLGYFDERLLGIGGEDGDMEWRYIDAFSRPMHNVQMPVIFNFWSMDATDNVHKSASGKYSLFNQTFLDQKFVPAETGHVGLFETPRKMVIEHPNQYPSEGFYLDHRDEV